MGVKCATPSLAAAAAKSATMASKIASEKPTRSILLTARTVSDTRSSEVTARCRLVCSTTPDRASTRITATSAVEAPVTVFRVYCT